MEEREKKLRNRQKAAMSKKQHCKIVFANKETSLNITKKKYMNQTIEIYEKNNTLRRPYPKIFRWTE
jgi:hypothetical protein